MFSSGKLPNISVCCTVRLQNLTHYSSARHFQNWKLAQILCYYTSTLIAESYSLLFCRTFPKLNACTNIVQLYQYADCRILLITLLPNISKTESLHKYCAIIPVRWLQNLTHYSSVGHFQNWKLAQILCNYTSTLIAESYSLLFCRTFPKLKACANIVQLYQYADCRILLITLLPDISKIKSLRKYCAIIPVCYNNNVLLILIS